VDGENVRILLATNNGAYQGTTATAIGTGTWVHLAFTWDAASDTIRLYRNGTQFGTPGRTGDTLRDLSATTNYPPLLIGGDQTDPNETGTDNLFFPGAIDEVRLSRSARSADWLKAGVREPGQP
jgi:hypothetical protein